MFKSKLHFWTFEILLVVLIIYFSTKITFLFKPVVIFTTTLFFPILISGFLYFLLNPVVDFIERWKAPRTLSILILYVVFISVISSVIGLIGPTIVNQFHELIGSMPFYIAELRTMIENLYHSSWFQWMVTQEYISFDKIQNTLTDYVSTITNNVSQGFQVVLNVIANVTLIIVTVPFILFYMFKDGDKFPTKVAQFFPKDYRHEVLRILKETGETLSIYIRGQMIVSLLVGIFTFIGYLLIGLPYALLLGLVIAITNIIPYVGPFIGVAPAVIVGLLDSPTKALLVVLIVTIVQQIDGNVISPLIIGKRLDTHPLTIIILLLVAGNFAGILGMILAVPTYAVSKTIIINLYRLIQLRQEMKTD
ncbi:AI-2E family transporter [Bacillus alveayuensis]|uniref:PurR-regulated permease PerM n=1 Tax=Aeribacillus alveayuensis TaxID=279215 RepID=A0ABT9VQH8_9BACI|nr:AI-2E family transporter [Bacillus alveayuensis]MDQ0162930.1 putative PurR-regulated permease PerM [Bacillus alveayuensis]